MWRNEDYIEFNEDLLLLNSESSVFPSADKMVKMKIGL
jgi:hypothetical protein